MLLKNKTYLISGATRGIGKSIALNLAKEGANIIIAAKSIVENEKLGGTIYSAAEEIEAAGGRSIAVQCDIREEEMIIKAIDAGIAKFGGIDGVINNASAISLTNTNDTSSKKFDLMHDINVRGTFLVTKHCIPYLKVSENPHILTLSPPISLQPKWLGPHIAYTMSKYNMTMMAMGWAEEFKEIPIASNALWPKTTIATAAVNNLLGGDQLIQMSRTPDIVADAAVIILSQPAKECSSNSFIDENILMEKGITDFSKYSVNPEMPLYTDLFLD